MRTTLTLDADVAEKSKKVAAKLNKPFKVVINEALRKGLDQLQGPLGRQPYYTQPHALGLRKECNLDNIQELIAQCEGEDAR